MDDYTIALYFPNNVKDAVTVEYEAKDIGISDIMFGNMMAGEFGEMADDVVPAVQELFAKSKGLIFVPTQFDTCPRVTIEAKMLDCALILSNKVQHAKEDWFNGSKEDIINYMKERLDFFWTTVSK